MSYASATEPLRAANLLAGKEIYEPLPLLAWRRGGATSGVRGTLQRASAARSWLHTVFVCAGGGQSIGRSPAILARPASAGTRKAFVSAAFPAAPICWRLRACSRTAISLFTGSMRPPWSEAFPDLAPRQARYVLDGNRITCGGGVAPLDMMHALIAERMGADFARRVSDWYLHTVSPSPVRRSGRRWPSATACQPPAPAHRSREDGSDDRGATLPGGHGARPGSAYAIWTGCSRQSSEPAWHAAYLQLRLAQAVRLLRQSPLVTRPDRLCHRLLQRQPFLRAFREITAIPRRLARTPDCHSTCELIARGAMTASVTGELRH